MDDGLGVLVYAGEELNYKHHIMPDQLQEKERNEL